jgi:hypothetical protein
MSSHHDQIDAMTREHLRELLLLHRGLKVVRGPSHLGLEPPAGANANRAHALLDRLQRRPASPPAH